MIQNRSKAELILEIQTAIKSQLTLGPREYYTIYETMKVLGISRTHLYTLRKLGKLETRPVGTKKVVITKRSIDALVFGDEQE